MAPKAVKPPVTCNWVPSIVTESKLSEFVKSGHLPKKDVMSYRAPNPSEEKPQPKEGEVIIFTDHMSRGFAPPGSKFFRDVLHFFDLNLRTLNPIPCQISATSKFSVRFILEKSPAYLCSKSCSI